MAEILDKISSKENHYHVENTIYKKKNLTKL